MGMLDSILDSVERHPQITPEQHSTLLQSAMEMLGKGSKLSGIVSNAESQGLGGVVGSWIGQDSNQAIAPQQVPGVLGQEQVDALAQRVGISPAIANAALSRLLPVIVDKLTPHGRLPQAA